MSARSNLNVTYTTTTTGAQVAKSDAKEVDRINAQMITNLRRTAQIGMALFQTFGGALDQTYGLAIEAALLTLELVATTTAASLATPGGAILAFARVGAIVSLITLIAQIETGRIENQRQTQASVSLFRMLTFR